MLSYGKLPENSMEMLSCCLNRRFNTNLRHQSNKMCERPFLSGGDLCRVREICRGWQHWQWGNRSGGGGLPSYKCARTVTRSRKLIPTDGANVALHSVLFRQISLFPCTGLWNGTFINQMTGRSIRGTSQNKTEGMRFGSFFCLKRPDWCWDHPALYSFGIKRLECEAEHTSPLRDDFKNTWSHTSTNSCDFTSWCSVTNINNIILLILQTENLSLVYDLRNNWTEK